MPYPENFFRNICTKIGIPKSQLSPDIGQKLEGGNSDFRFSVQSLIKENFHSSRTNNDIDMKLGPVTKIDNRNKATSKNLTITSCQLIVLSLSFFQFMVNLELSGSRVSDAYSVKLTFSSKVTFYVTKTENRTKKSLIQLSHYCFE